MTIPPRRGFFTAGCMWEQRKGRASAPALQTRRIYQIKPMTILSSDRTALLALVERFPRQRVIMLGDLVADESVYGEIMRVSREAPVLILKEREKQIAPGGGANAANNLAALGAHVTPVGVVGEDESGDALLHYFRERHISTRHIVRVPRLPDPHEDADSGRTVALAAPADRAHRPRAGPPAGGGSANRLDPGGGGVARLLHGPAGCRLRLLAPPTPRKWIPFAGGLRRHALPITIDSRYDLLTYKNLTAATPNEPEVEAAFGQTIGNDLERLHALGRKFLHRQGLQALLVTRGRDGMALFEPRRPPQHLPIFGSDQAVDVTGAGDTVIAAFTLALAAGAGFLASRPSLPIAPAGSW